MGSSPRDRGTMQTASAGATQADAANARLANQQADFNAASRSKLFGPNVNSGDFSGGSLSGFLNPENLKVSEPTGTFGLQYNKAKEGIATAGQNTRGALSRYMANRGFGGAPAGFAADEQRKALADQTNQEGAAFTDYASKSYDDALKNFWNATSQLSGQGDAALSAAISANSAAANNYSNCTARPQRRNRACRRIPRGRNSGSRASRGSCNDVPIH
jgi:hypothetical protein